MPVAFPCRAHLAQKDSDASVATATGGHVPPWSFHILGGVPHRDADWKAARGSALRQRDGLLTTAPAAGSVSRARAWRRRAPSLRGRLLLLVVACVLPVVLFGLGDAYVTYRASHAEAARRMLDLARSLALAVERDVEGRLAALQVLALSPAARNGDAEGFRPVAEAVLAQQMPGASILLLREDGQQVMNTLLPPGAPLPARRDTATLRRLFATGKPSASDVFFGLVRREPIVALEVPVLGPDGAVAYGLTLNPTAEAFVELIRRQRLPENWTGALFDGSGQFIARTRDPERLVGRLAGPELLRRVLSEREGFLDTTSRDGVPVLVAFSRVESIGWTAAVNVPLAELAAPAWLSALRSVASGLVFLLVGLALALFVSRRITGPIASLRGLAATPDGGRAPGASSGLAEVDEVAAALLAGTRERRAAAAALRESEFRLRLALDASQLGIWLWEAGGELSGDDRAKALFGLPRGARVDYATWIAAIEPEDRPAVEAASKRALDASDPHDEFEHEYRVRRPDGRIVWLRAVGRAAFEADPGRPAGRRAARMLGTIADVTERRAADERQRLLLREVDHRAKNALAVALSLVRLAPRDDAARFADGVEGRIAAMARAHSLLAEQRWDGADLRALAEGELDAYADRVRLEGPPARLSAGAAQPVAMVLHELATNAAKHGALSAPGGRVSLSWDFAPRGAAGDGQGAGAGLHLRWRETGGPAVARPPGRSGFGSRLLASLTERQLGGRLTLDWEPDGLSATVALPPRHASPAGDAPAVGGTGARSAPVAADPPGRAARAPAPVPRPVAAMAAAGDGRPPPLGR